MLFNSSTSYFSVIVNTNINTDTKSYVVLFNSSTNCSNVITDTNINTDTKDYVVLFNFSTSCFNIITSTDINTDTNACVCIKVYSLRMLIETLSKSFSLRILNRCDVNLFL